MGTLGLEAILIGDVVDGVDLSVIGGEGVRAAHSDSLVLGTGVLQGTLFVVPLAITGLPAVCIYSRVLSVFLVGDYTIDFYLNL